MKTMRIVFPSIFRSYLWGMETIAQHQLHTDQPSFRSYLWGMETYAGLRLKEVLDLDIPILPMRHGNIPTCDISPRWQKPFRSYLWGMETRYGWAEIWCICGFRSYLWGMETPSSCMYPPPPAPIPILPTRHGNAFFSAVTVGSDWNSDPTYKAWKHEIEMYIYPEDDPDSDPTYEAWKRG